MSLMLALALLGSAFSTAAAQSQTVLFVTPEHTDVPLGNQVEVAVEVYLGLNINAFDLTLIYDPDVLSLASWAHSDYLSNLANVKVEDEPGRLRIAATQLAQPAVSGDGELLILIFDTVSAGPSAIDWVEVILSDSQGNKTEPVLDGGSIEVIVAATYTPTPTPTQTPTPKPTITPQPTTGDTGYPVKEEPTATSYVYPQQQPTDGAGVALNPNLTESGEAPAGEGEVVDTEVPTQDGYPGAVSSGDSEGSEGPVLDQGAAEKANSDLEQTASSNQTFLNIMLWVVLVVGVLVMVVMIIVAIRRPRRKHEDYLL